MRYEVAAVVRGAPEAVFAWWTDYGPPGHKERVWHGIGWSDRKVLSREGDVVELRESVLGATILRHRIELHRARLAFKETTADWEAWWLFEPHPQGTRIRRQVEVRGKAARMVPRGLTVWGAKKDLDAHAREYEKGHLR